MAGPEVTAGEVPAEIAEFGKPEALGGGNASSEDTRLKVLTLRGVFLGSSCHKHLLRRVLTYFLLLHRTKYLRL